MSRLLIGALLVTSVLLLPGCGGELVTYTDPDYGFTFQYADSWDLYDVPADELPVQASKSVGVFDPRGSDAGNDLTFDYFSVDIYNIDTEAVPTLSELEEGFAQYLDQLKTSDDTLRVIEEPGQTAAVNGLPAWEVTYSYSVGDTRVLCVEQRVLDTGGRIYSLRMQSSEDTWEANADVFSNFLDSFSTGETP